MHNLNCQIVNLVFVHHTNRNKNCDVKFVLSDTKSSFLLLSIESILRFGLYIVHSIYGCKFTRIFSIALFTVNAVSSVLLDFVILDEWPLDTAEFLKTRLLKPSSCFTEDLIDCLGAGFKLC